MIAHRKQDLDVGDVAVGSGELGEAMMEIAQVGATPQRAEEDIDLLRQRERAFLEVALREARGKTNLERRRCGEDADDGEHEQDDQA